MIIMWVWDSTWYYEK